MSPTLNTLRYVEVWSGPTEHNTSNGAPVGNQSTINRVETMHAICADRGVCNVTVMPERDGEHVASATTIALCVRHCLRNTTHVTSTRPRSNMKIQSNSLYWNGRRSKENEHVQLAHAQISGSRWRCAYEIL